MYWMNLAIFNRSGNVAVLMLLFIRADIDGAKTLFANFIILGPIPSRPVAFVELIHLLTERLNQLKYNTSSGILLLIKD